ncbi:MAG TPA: YCF48-related protein [Terriglobales bacterium]|nr:YCF48-related protein [Terriglobales bacterium]
MLFLVLLLSSTLFAAEWVSLGPDGGDARSLAADPSNPQRIFLGTSAGELFLSTDGGTTWTRYAHLGSGYDYVLDHVVIDPTNPQTMYAGAWSVENNGGDVFKSTDGGKSWQALAGIHGKSVRALAMAPADSKILAVGALDGVYRSLDAGQTWTRISPESNAELKNVESLAFDPKKADVIYAGTWHLPWKTEDGGRTWSNIKQGVIDDSDVFSIIVDQNNPSVVFASACSGIYKSETGGQLFKKVQGIPFSARRTRVLQQDPTNSAIVYAGTTEGLWKTIDSGATWTRVSPANYVVNDVLVDARHPETVLLATDRTGVLLSRDGGRTFASANRGFSHRQVTAVVADKESSRRIYASLINNREFGGVYLSDDDGSSWSSLNNGLGTRDVFTIEQTSSGALLAGTNNGIFLLDGKDKEWRPINLTLREKVTTIPIKGAKKGAPKTRVKREWIKGVLTGRVAQLKADDHRWYAATSQGLFRSLDSGKSWTGGPVVGNTDFISVDHHGDLVFATTPRFPMLSKDDGNTWTILKLPTYVSRITSVAVGPKDELWMVTHLGTYRSQDEGQTWQHELGGDPLANIWFVTYDRKGERLVGVAGNRNQVIESRDDGKTWTVAAKAHYPIRNVTSFSGRMLAVTDFNGVVAQPETEVSTKAAGGGN